MCWATARLPCRAVSYTVVRSNSIRVTLLSSNTSSGQYNRFDTRFSEISELRFPFILFRFSVLLLSLPCINSICLPPGRGHQPFCRQLLAPHPVPFRPMAVLPPGRYTLRKPTVRQSFHRAVYPSEAQCLFHHLHVPHAICTDCCGLMHRHPAFFLARMVFFQPCPQLCPIRILQQRPYLHSL